MSKLSGHILTKKTATINGTRMETDFMSYKIIGRYSSPKA